MPKLRRISGAEVISVFEGFGFELVSSRGSHAKLRRFVGDTKHTLTVPTHSELDTGNLRAIIRHVTAYIPEPELVPSCPLLRDFRDRKTIFPDSLFAISR